jgi:glycosyltransferase involved in cell wall biosynthesis
MRIAFISTMSGYSWGGSEELWSQAALRLRTAGHEVSATTGDNPPVSPKLTALAERGLPVRVRKEPRAPLRRAIWTRLTGRPTREPNRAWLRHQRPELVVISQGGHCDGCGWMDFCRAAGLPYVAIVHCNSEISWFKDREIEEIAGLYEAAAAVYCVSRGNLRQLEWQLGRALPKARIIWNPNPAAALAELPWPTETGKARLACVGRLDPAFKGQDILFQVLAQPPWRARAVEVNLYGAGPAEKTLRTMAQRLALGGVNFRGYADVAEIWRTNHLLVMPSRQEGLPLALVEAMSCGRPAVVTDVGGNAELGVEGETGFVASAAAVGPLAEALELAWAKQTDWSVLGRAARRRIMELVPRDPVGDFCEMLVGLVPRGHSTA